MREKKGVAFGFCHYSEVEKVGSFKRGTLIGCKKKVGMSKRDGLPAQMGRRHVMTS